MENGGNQRCRPKSNRYSSRSGILESRREKSASPWTDGSIGMAIRRGLILSPLTARFASELIAESSSVSGPAGSSSPIAV